MSNLTPVEVRPFHLYIGGYARAFYRPQTTWQRIVLWFRGWRPHIYGPCWQKPNGKLKRDSFVAGDL